MGPHDELGAEVLLKVSGTCKTYPPGVAALVNADLELRRGEVHALVGENGAGKSTLSRIIAGVTLGDSGTMRLGGRNYAPATRSEAEHCGVRMVMQELNLVPTLTVAESIYIDRLPNRFGWIQREQLVRDASPLLHQVGLGRIDPSMPVGNLGVGQQQLVEIAAGLSRDCKILILDEPTAALTDTEVALLFEQITRLKKAGVGILYISHRMEEIARISDYVTVLRDGRVVGGGATAALPTNEIIRLMVGRDLIRSSFQNQIPAGSVAMRVYKLSAPPAVKEVSFEIRNGEILGFAGLMGSGRTETVRAIFGADPKASGAIYLEGATAPAKIATPRDAIRAGIALLTEDRKGEGLVLPWAVRQNVTLPCLQRSGRMLGWIDRQCEAGHAQGLAERLGIRCASVEQPVAELSGGNQQKVIIAKWLHRDCKILMFDEPTRGIDVGAKFEIYRLLSELAARGRAVIVVSSDLPELFAICNRIAVLSAGSLVKIVDQPEFNQDEIMRAALKNY